MSRNIRILRSAEAQGSSESALGRNMKKGTLAVKTTTTKSLMALALMFWAHTAWSFTVSGTTYTTTGSQSDVQAAVNAAPDNGTATVVIPNGTYSWAGTLTIAKALTLAGASSGGVTINNTNATSVMINATSSANGNLNIYWLNVTQTVNNGTGLNNGDLICDRTEPSPYTVLVHDCTFDTGSYFVFAVYVFANGVIFWNDNFPGTGGTSNCLTGIDFACDKYGWTSSWSTPDSFGTQDTTGLMNSYVENCTFANGSDSVVNCEDNARVVWRYNTMTDALFSSHGQDTGQYGVREMEVYNNTFTRGSNSSGMNCWVSFNGGTGIVFNNSMVDIPDKTGVQLNVYAINRVDAIPCQTGYPAARQVGQGWSASSQATFGNPVVPQDGIGAVTEGVYVWGNTGTETTDPNYVGINQFTPDECGNGQLIGTYVQEGRDYFVGTARPGYTPYTYPHPLHTRYALSGGGGNPTPTPTPAVPAAPQNLRVE
jgi:hypothetical protein